MIALLLTAIALTPQIDSSLNYISGCRLEGLGCGIGATTVAGTDLSAYGNFHATFTLSYKFTCGSGDGTTTSSIFMDATTDIVSREFLKYQNSGTITLNGVGPLRLTDAKPSNLAETYQNPRCGLFIDEVSAVPSERQLTTWSLRRSGQMKNLVGIKKFFADKPIFAFWQTSYSQNPGAFRPIIEQKIQELIDHPELDPIGIDLIQYQAILGDAPDGAVEDVFSKVVEIARKVIVSAEALEYERALAQMPPDDELRAEIESCKSLIGVAP